MAHLGTRLTEAIEPAFRAHGLKRNKHGVFIRPTAHGFDNFLWATHPTVTASTELAQKYSLLMGVRHNQVEDAVNQLEFIYGLENKKRTTTVSTPLELFPPTQQRAYSVVLEHNASDAAISIAAASIIDVLTADALPFYAAYASIEHCAAGLNSALDQRSHFLFNNYETRMYHAIAAAHFASPTGCHDVVQSWLSCAESTLPASIWHTAQDRLTKLFLVLGISQRDRL